MEAGRPIIIFVFSIFGLSFFSKAIKGERGRRLAVAPGPRGVGILVGGGSMLANLDILLRETTGLPVMLAEDPLTAVAEGTGRCLDELKLLKEVTIRT